METFKKEESLTRLQAKQLVAGNTIGFKRKYKDHAKRIAKKCDDYNNRSKIDFLQGIAHNFQLKI
jgi:hypothetical protein